MQGKAGEESLGIEDYLFQCKVWGLQGYLAHKKAPTQRKAGEESEKRAKGLAEELNPLILLLLYDSQA